MMPKGGAILPVSVVTGRPIQGGRARRVFGFQPGETDRKIMGGAAIPVRVVTQAEVDAGLFVVEGDPQEMPVMSVSGRSVVGGAAIPVFPVNAWPTPTPVPPAAFTPADLPGAPAFVYSTRWMVAGYEGPLVNIIRDSDDAEEDFGHVANSPDLDTAAVAAFLGASAGYLAFYDQSGNARPTIQANKSKRPLYVASGQNGKPVARFDGTADTLAITAFAFATANLTLAAMVSPDTATGTLDYLYGHDNAGATNAFYMCHLTGTSGQNGFYQSTFKNFGAAASGAQVIVHRYEDPETGQLFRNGAQIGTDQTFAAVSSPDTDTKAMCSNNLGAASFFDGDVGDYIFWPTALSTGDRNTVEADMNSYWAVY